MRRIREFADVALRQMSPEFEAFVFEAGPSVDPSGAVVAWVVAADALLDPQ